MYITGVKNVMAITFENGEWVVKLKCPGVLTVPFLSADTELVYLADELTWSCRDCLGMDDARTCKVTKIERKQNGDSNAD